MPNNLQHFIKNLASFISFLAAGFAFLLAAPVPCSAADMIQGIDVYHGDGEVDWRTVKKNGFEFAFIKSTEGTNYVDKRFDENMKGATAAGVLIGPYHFCRIDNDKDGKKFEAYDGSPFTAGTDHYDDAVAEAKAFLKVILPYYRAGHYLPPVADVEGLPKFGDAKLEREFISNWMLVFSDEVQKELGVRPIIYTSKSGAKTRYTPEFVEGQELWLAYWKKSGIESPPTADDTPSWKPWLFWQWSATGSVEGVPGSGKHHDCDKDVFGGTQKQLEALLIHRDH
jgi:GH25 family lysozyme M1 (1,4-beta-N-acetylmuramidase)